MDKLGAADDRLFLDFCYDQYKIDLQDAETIYPRSSVLIGAITLLSGATVKLARLDLLVRWYEAPLFFFTAVSTGLIALLVVFSSASLLLAVYPRRYKRVAPMSKWREWREKYLEILTEENASQSASHSTTSGQCVEYLTSALTAAQAENASLNEIRRKHYQRAVLTSVLMTIGVLLLAILRFCLFLGGVE